MSESTDLLVQAVGWSTNSSNRNRGSPARMRPSPHTPEWSCSVRLLLLHKELEEYNVYQWRDHKVFSLSVTEIGTLVGLDARDSCEFLHDPLKGRSDEGKVRKVLKVEPLPDGSGHFFNLSVRNKMLNLDESIYIPVTKAKYMVLVSAFNFLLSYLIGCHSFTSPIRLEDNTSPNNNANQRYGGDYEWSR